MAALWGALQPVTVHCSHVKKMAKVSLLTDMCFEHTIGAKGRDTKGRTHPRGRAGQCQAIITFEVQTP